MKHCPEFYKLFIEKRFYPEGKNQFLNRQLTKKPYLCTLYFLNSDEQKEL
jgi:hypothetical protein